MGIQARERQDELFDLRVEKRQLLYALTLAICGVPAEKVKAKTMLADMASDPAMAKHVIAAFDGSPQSFEDFEDIRRSAMQAVSPPRHQVPVLAHMHG